MNFESIFPSFWLTTFFSLFFFFFFFLITKNLGGWMVRLFINNSLGRTFPPGARNFPRCRSMMHRHVHNFSWKKRERERERERKSIKSPKLFYKLAYISYKTTKVGGGASYEINNGRVVALKYLRLRSRLYRAEVTVSRSIAINATLKNERQ